MAYKEFRTLRIVFEYLNSLGIDAEMGKEKTGVVGLIKGNKPGETVALRADLDALSLQEENECEYRSVEPGIMHACGHDVNTACLLGAAEVLNGLRNKLNGNVKLIFQPAEETIGGALPMIKEGVLKNPDVDVCAAIHVWPDIPVGKISVNNGYTFASIDNFTISVKGKGGHGAIPQLAIDPIVIGAQIVNSLQTIVSRQINPLIPIVISVCSFHSGTGENIIPEGATLKGTVRTYDREVRQRLAALMDAIIKGIVESYGGNYDFQYNMAYPAVFNDKETTDMMIASVEKILGKDSIADTMPTMGGEDFAYFAQSVPSTYIRLGCSNVEKGIIHPLHNSRFNVDEDCILTGIQVLSQFTVDYLNRQDISE